MARSAEQTWAALSKRVSVTLSRLVRAHEHTQELVGISTSLLRDARRIRSKSPTQTNTADIAWSSGDGLTQCRVVAHARDQHEVTVTVRGDTLVSRIFADPVEATDEAERLRHAFIG